MAESYDAGTIVIQTYSAGSQVIQSYDAGAFVVPQNGTPTLPSWLTHAWEDPGVADGAAITTHTDLIGGVVASSSGTARPTWRDDYAGTGVAGVEWDGVDDILTTTTSVNLTAGFSYTALVYFDTLANFRVLYDTGTASAQLSQSYLLSTGALVVAKRNGGVQSVQTPAASVSSGAWVILTVVHSGTLGETAIWLNGTKIITGTVTNPAAAATIRFGRGLSPINTNGMKGASNCMYLGPIPTDLQLAELRTYINYRSGLAL